ncbi:divalent-cation tolerance protein CutA [Crocosphaera sp. XPORK-15E]|nr:divalent-cation tolerance protein CutA [Crocosphaera sp. XPORK-15E]
MTLDNNYITVITTTSQKEDADNIARVLLEQKLAGCIQIIGPITSHYWWQNQICHDEEWICFIKSSQDIYDELERVIKEIHPYDTPEIIALPIMAGSQDYLSWLSQQLKQN